MPLINDRYYANPQYGSALERDRAADGEFRRAHGEPKPSWLDHFLGFADGSDTNQAKPSQPSQPRKNQSQLQAKTKVVTDDRIGNLIYNETSGLRPTSETGKGSPQDLHEARVGAGTVAKNLDSKGQKLGKPLTAPTELTRKEAKAVRNYSPAKHAYEDSQAAASKASGDKSGPTHFYLDHGQGKPKWAEGKAPKQSYGPFRNDAGHGDVPKGAKVWIRVYD
jgi:hypothetical protein